jgi:hypothetical protein
LGIAYSRREKVALPWERIDEGGKLRNDLRIWATASAGGYMVGETPRVLAVCLLHTSINNDTQSLLGVKTTLSVVE